MRDNVQVFLEHAHLEFLTTQQLLLLLDTKVSLELGYESLSERTIKPNNRFIAKYSAIITIVPCFQISQTCSLVFFINNSCFFYQQEIDRNRFRRINPYLSIRCNLNMHLMKKECQKGWTQKHSVSQHSHNFQLQTYYIFCSDSIIFRTQLAYILL